MKIENSQDFELGIQRLFLEAPLERSGKESVHREAHDALFMMV